MNALTHLNQLADAAKAAKHPTVPAFALVKSKYSDKDANSLTTAIVDFCTLSGHFATRLSSTGSYRADLGQFVPSKQRAGLPDVLACVDGQFVAIEVKVGKDRLSRDQKEAIAALEKAGAWVFVAKSFSGVQRVVCGQISNRPIRMSTSHEFPTAPSPADLIKITRIQQHRLAELTRQTVWTESDFAEVFYCHQQWLPQQKEWFVAVDILRQLAFDVRTPDAKAALLQNLITQFDSQRKPQEP